MIGFFVTDQFQRTQYQNAQNTFKELLNMNVIPIVNENDTLAVAVRDQQIVTRNPLKLQY